ncbi:hypothetical protein C8R45DRAFT_970294 [Mycena sanguinolenta]|nr:hypothetical protein C8R45DRAFT_970294 [Mycena sanguinolenta]
MASFRLGLNLALRRTVTTTRSLRLNLRWSYRHTLRTELACFNVPGNFLARAMTMKANSQAEQLADSTQLADCGKTGLIEIFNGGAPIVDIIAVHGLGSSFPSSWTEKESGVMFLKEFLPKDFPQARILAFVYPSQPFTDPIHVDLRELGARLLRTLVHDRDGSSIKRHRPIIFIGHSFGGLVIKQALVHAASHNRHVLGRHPEILDATQGILFLGTPHLGSKYAILGLVRAWVSRLSSPTHTTLLNTVREKSWELRRLNESFLSLPVIHNIHDNIVCFFELKGEVGLFGRVVDEDSACLDSFLRVSLNVAHRELNKYSKPDGEYDAIRRFIQQIYASIHTDWEFSSHLIILGTGMLVPGIVIGTQYWGEQNVPAL